MEFFLKLSLMGAWILLPAFLALFFKNDSETSLLWIGKFFGLASASTLAMATILGCRSFWLDRYFGSLASAYRVHHQISLVALVFLAIHIFGTALPFLSVDIRAAWDFLSDGSDPVLFTGWLALAFLVIGTILSYFKKIHRPVWRTLHRILFLSLPVLLVHLWIGSTSLGVAEGIVIVYLLMAFAISLAHFFYPQALRKTAHYRVSSVTSLNHDVIEISMTPVQEKMRFFPGQFVYLSVDCQQDCGVSHEPHPYTINSDPDDPRISIAVKSLGDDSSKLQHIRPGHPATLEGPYGGLLNKITPAEPQLWIAGGIGITPFVSYLRHWMKNKNEIQNIFFIILFKRQKDLVFSDEFVHFPGLKTIIHIDEKNGPPQLKNLLPEDWKNRTIVVTGPITMIKNFKRELHFMGARSIKTEEFDF